MEFDKEKAVCFTGHRDIPEETRDALSSLLRQTILIYIRRGFRYFIAGGAFGFDMMAEQCVASLRSEGHDICLILALPCRDQTVKWKNTEDIKNYQRLLGEADHVHYVSSIYDRGCMQKRNRYMVDNSSVCIAYKTKDTGGTAYTCRYAQKLGRELVNLGAVASQLTFY